MNLNQNGHPIRLAVEDGVRIVRFTRPDLREQLEGNADDCSLYRALYDRVLHRLTEGQTLVLNFALIERFPTAFYSCLLKVRKDVLARRARLVLCRIGPEHLEIFKLFRANRLFDIAGTEGQALRMTGTRKVEPNAQ
jgi:anti-anti-sigma regulatory factor